MKAMSAPYPGWREQQAQPSITCPRCGRTSYHPKDIQTGYCGACHVFLWEESLLLILDAMPAEEAGHAKRMRYIYLRTLGRWLLSGCRALARRTGVLEAVLPR